MQFTTTQAQALKANILADQTLVPKTSGPGTDFQAIADALNLATATQAWRSQTSADVVADAVVWANLTPAAALDGSALGTQRELRCQGKQFNLQMMLQGRTFIPSSKASYRAGLQDALTGIPSKADGTNQAAGWMAVQAAMQRAATRAEVVLKAGGAGPVDLGWEGLVQVNEIGEILAS